MKLLDDGAYPPIASLPNPKTLILSNYNRGRGLFLLSDHAHMRNQMPHLEQLLLGVRPGLRIPNFLGLRHLAICGICRRFEYWVIKRAEFLDALSGSPLLETLVLCDVMLLMEASGEDQPFSFQNLRRIVLSDCTEKSISAFFSKSEIHPAAKISISFSRRLSEDQYL